MEMEIELTNLVTALETATALAKHLQSTTDSTHIYASLHAAHRQLSQFLTYTQPQPSADVTGDVDEPMQTADEQQQVAEDSAMDTMEERMKDVSIRKNKRMKRSLSPASVAEGERVRRLECEEVELARARLEYDPCVARLRALDLIYQFHC